MDRRTFLKHSAITVPFATAGCASDEPDIKDTDGDGVIDSQDYAPKDPEVQEKSDINTATTTASPTATTTPEPTTTTTTTTTTTATTTTTTTTERDPNALHVDSTEFESTSTYFTKYSVDSTTLRIHPESPSVAGFSGLEVWVLAYDYADRTSYYGFGHTTIELDGSATNVTVEIDWDDYIPTNTRLFYGAVLAEEGKPLGELGGGNTSYVHETDAFKITSDTETIERFKPLALKNIGDKTGDNFERTVREGEFMLDFTGSTNGKSWVVNFTIYKSAYVAAVRRDHGRRRSEFVAYEMGSGFADELAVILHDESIANSFTEKREKVEFIIDFVQHLPYVPDDVSTPFDDYTKFGAETLCEMGGDCEDTSILLASILQSEPFAYDMVLIQPPEHMAVGIYGNEDLPGYYWERDERKYYYIETTGVGWGIGDLPDEYKEASAYVIQV